MCVCVCVSRETSVGPVLFDYWRSARPWLRRRWRRWRARGLRRRARRWARTPLANPWPRTGRQRPRPIAGTAPHGSSDYVLPLRVFTAPKIQHVIPASYCIVLLLLLLLYCYYRRYERVLVYVLARTPVACVPSGLSPKRERSLPVFRFFRTRIQYCSCTSGVSVYAYIILSCFYCYSFFIGTRSER